MSLRHQDFSINDQNRFSIGNKSSADVLATNIKDDQVKVVSTAYENLRLTHDNYTDQIQQILSSTMELNYQAAGAGSFGSIYPKVFTRFDRFNKRYYTPNSVYSGYTFITRPRLCLTSTNLHADRYLQLFNTDNPNTIQFALRCLLDTVYSNPANPRTSQFNQCPFFDPYNPFLAILTNTVQDISGFPSQHLETFTTEGGLFSEDMRFAIGSDRHNKSFDITMTFTDIEGGLVMSLFKLWMTYIDLVTTGEVLAYTDDIIHRRLNYTVSIYRFLVDPNNKYIKYAAKCTGCFPVDRPSGAVFDVSRAERYVEAAKNFSIQFACNKFEEQDPIILLEFNTLMRRYNPFIHLKNTSIIPTENNARYMNVPDDLDYNYVGLPYIELSSKHRPVLQFRYIPNNISNSKISSVIASTDKNLDAIQTQFNINNKTINKLGHY